MSALRPLFSDFVAAGRRRGTLIVQPRMGFGDQAKMRRGLTAVREAGLPAVGTVTLDSYTRVGDHDRAAMAVESGVDINGYPLVALGAARARGLFDGLHSPEFPVQVRHGSPLPGRIFAEMVAAGVEASEGGPVSYCLPYSRVPLRTATEAWSRATEFLAGESAHCHLESFGGCMLGQLCPPGLLVALSVLECVFFAEHGIRSVSASYAQQTHPGQDAEALRALRRLCAEHLPGIDWHVVLYTFMGLYPESGFGARELTRESVELAALTGTERLIVKTTAEAHRIPTIEENIEALRLAHEFAVAAPAPRPSTSDSEVYLQARALIDTVRALAPTMAQALPLAFERGLLDVPYCLHPDNRNLARSVIGADGRLQWWDTGEMPLPPGIGGRRNRGALGAARLLKDLSYHRVRLDPPAAAGHPTKTERGECLAER